MFRCAFYAVVSFLSFESCAWAWGGAEHSSITAAALSALSPGALAFIGTEAARLVMRYCNYPDFNWSVFGTCRRDKSGKALRIPDDRRDFNASFYCGFDEYTGRGEYFGHGPELGKEMPPPDEHCRKMYGKGHFASAAAGRAAGRLNLSMAGGAYFDVIRLLGVASHYLEDSTPPPHTLAVPGGSNETHHKMEAISDHSQIDIAGYAPRMLGATPAEFQTNVAILSEAISRDAHALAVKSLAMVEQGKLKEAEAITVECARMAARAVADMIHTAYELNKASLPSRPVSKPGLNLLFNPSFDIDDDGDLQPDGWVREWGDPFDPCDMHLWDKVSPESGACARLFDTSAQGAAWRSSRAAAVPVVAGGAYVLKAQARPQSATGESYVALRFQDERYSTLLEARSEAFSGSAPWFEVSVTGKAPAGAVDALAVCVSKGNRGSTLFDNMELRLT